jgi:hypothetical protein
VTYNLGRIYRFLWRFVLICRRDLSPIKTCIEPAVRSSRSEQTSEHLRHTHKEGLLDRHGHDHAQSPASLPRGQNCLYVDRHGGGGGAPVRLAYQPPTSSTFLSEQINYQHFFFRINQHQPSATSQTNRLIFFKTCIARFSLRGEQPGNKANNRGKHKAQEHKDKKTHNKTNETIYDDQVSQSPESPLGPTFELPPKYVALATPAGARLSHEHANSSLFITTRRPKEPESKSLPLRLCQWRRWQRQHRRTLCSPVHVSL